MKTHEFKHISRIPCCLCRGVHVGESDISLPIAINRALSELEHCREKHGYKASPWANPDPKTNQHP